MESMTGYGESRFSIEGVYFTFRVKSLNSRYLEPLIELPRELRWFEGRARQLLTDRFTRGRIEVSFEADRELPKTAIANPEILADYKKLFQEFYGKEQADIPITALVHLPGLFELRSQDWKSSQNRFEFYYVRALLRMQRQRQKEGRRILQWMGKRLRYIKRLSQKIAILEEKREKAQSKQIKQKLSNLLGEEKGNNARNSVARRLWAEHRDEIMQLFNRDISEEVDRLQIHLPEMLKILQLKEPVGKKLEFYLQELLREVNTLTAKTPDSSINGLGIDLKLEIEKLREQCRNLE